MPKDRQAQPCTFLTGFQLHLDTVAHLWDAVGLTITGSCILNAEEQLGGTKLQICAAETTKITALRLDLSEGILSGCHKNERCLIRLQRMKALVWPLSCPSVKASFQWSNSEMWRVGFCKLVQDKVFVTVTICVHGCGTAGGLYSSYICYVVDLIACARSTFGNDRILSSFFSFILTSNKIISGYATAASVCVYVAAIYVTYLL
jgi:hypothetical protein